MRLWWVSSRRSSRNSARFVARQVAPCPSIRRLPETLVNRIAAGEVVERPASALKELVENAIDAGRRAHRNSGSATAGSALLEVTDDGCGMSRDEIALALERHATSKLPDEAIEAVVDARLSRRGAAFDRQRRAADDREPGARRGRGLARVVDHGELTGEGPAALPPGTRIRVETLFAQVPARRKFLRTARSEYAACLDVVRRLAHGAARGRLHARA